MPVNLSGFLRRDPESRAKKNMVTTPSLMMRGGMAGDRPAKTGYSSWRTSTDEVLQAFGEVHFEEFRNLIHLAVRQLKLTRFYFF